ncbi:transcription factor [Ganoderma sinense ZZ0214-1]|uniref:Transcription factor n=1 Tax=Ganoderma sinense ZZ0214-1 TaxID=1077348 RepID=A0A2G8RV56_9APHY|nr:transcription factor [Ganoderma sinense ZZ0214-1]
MPEAGGALGFHTVYGLSYVEELEGRLERMERLMNKFLPDKDIAKELDDHQSDKDPTIAPSPASERSRGGGSQVESPLNPSGLSVVPPTPGSADNAGDNEPHSDSEGSQELEKELAEGMKKLSMHSPPLRYHGKSSGLVFIRSAMAMKNENVAAPPPPKRDGPQPWLKAFVEDDFPLIESSSFPPRDLLDTLVDLYFAQMNCCLPLLHEPTFKKSLAAGEHLRNGGFGATVLLVCAIGARFTRDPRVLFDGSDDHRSAGWRWFLPVERVRRMSFVPAKIYDLQICVLMTLFLDGTNAPQGAWPVVGAGIRIALDVGAHRKTMYSPTPTVEDELWRRAFWILVLSEWLTSYGLGRPSSIHDEDFDLALPTECDDEYWLSPEGEPSFKQPPDKPSKVAAFVCVLKLCQIVAFSMRTIYSTNKASAQLGQSDEQWEQRIVADLDSALNKWSDSLPTHLRWDPEQEDAVWLTQAANLRAFHYYTQFAVHRPFISAARRESPLSFPSVIICANGARSSIEVLEVLAKRTGSAGHRNMGILFMGGIVLMTNILGLKRAGRVVNSGKDLALVGKAVEMLQSLRYETHIAEPLGDMLHELMLAVREPLPPGAPIPEEAQERTPNTPEADEAQDTEVAGQPVPDGASSASPPTASASASAASALYMPPGVDFLQPGAFTFAFPAGPGDLGFPSATQVFAGPTGGTSTQRDPLDPIPPPSALSLAYGLLPRQEFGPTSTQPQLRHNAQGVGPHQFDVEGGQMFGLEPLGYSEPMSFLPSASQVQVETADYSQQQHILANAVSMEIGESSIDAGGPGSALIDDALMVWSNLPPAMGWEEWGAYFEDTNLNAGT